MLCMLFKIKSNTLRHLRGALSLPYGQARVIRGGLVVHMHPFAPLFTL